MKLTLGQAAKQVNVSKTTLSKAIKSGKLSAEKREDGSYAIDPAELQRYQEANKHRFQKVTGQPLQVDTPSETPVDTPVSTSDTTLYDQQIKLLNERIDELKEDRDQWRKQAQTLALTDQRTKTGIIAKLFGKSNAA